MIEGYDDQPYRGTPRPRSRHQKLLRSIAKNERKVVSLREEYERLGIFKEWLSRMEMVLERQRRKLRG